MYETEDGKCEDVPFYAWTSGLNHNFYYMFEGRNITDSYFTPHGMGKPCPRLASGEANTFYDYFGNL